MYPPSKISFKELYSTIYSTISSPADTVSNVIQLTGRLFNELSLDELSNLLHTTQSHTLTPGKNHVTLQIIKKIVSNVKEGKIRIFKMREVNALIKSGRLDEAVEMLKTIPTTYRPTEIKSKYGEIAKLYHAKGETDKANALKLL